jgi:hypothetical protein
MPNAAIVLCLDASDSMRYYNYFGPAKTDAGSFVYIMNTGDSIGATAFSDNAWTAYPTASSVVALISSDSIQDGANAAIMGLATVSQTNITAGLAISAGLLSNAAAPKAIVLLSDGEYNKGGNPLNSLPSVKVYTIALGNYGQTQLLRDIATRTGGTYHFVSNVRQLADVYNEIIGQTQVATVIANNAQNLNQNRFWTLPATVAQGSSEATFSITWTNWAVTYTPNTPVGNQVNVTLQNPSGLTVAATPSGSGNGFVVFKIQNPQAGSWEATIWSSANLTLETSGGAFNPQLNIQMQVEAPMTAVVGESVPLTAEIRDGDGSRVEGVRITAHVEMPAMNPEDAIEKHRAALDALKLDGKEELSDGARMMALQMQRGPDEELLPYNHIPLAVEKDQDGIRRLAFTPKYKGGHIVRLHATGHAPNSNRDFSLSRRISVWADQI